MKTLHFTLGPVQSFVEQARRTRDLWAGSFLLSYLSGHAMKAVMDAGGKIVFPTVDDDSLLKAIRFKEGNPQIGSLPNRFKAEVPKGFDPKACEKAVRDAWQHVADAVWEKYIKSVASEQTEHIWQRQVKNFWDVAWIIGESNGKDDGAWLDQRKNWRSYQPPEEGGDHCTLMGDWQELSGFIRARERDKQKAFWGGLRSKLGTLELGEHERLCAISLIKRLYPKIAKEAIGWSLEVQNWPSTPYMAAVPWLEKAHPTQAARKYLTAIDRVNPEGAFSEHNSGLSCLKNAGRYARLDGNFFHNIALQNANVFPDIDEAQRRCFLEHLKEVNSEVGHPTGPFYALLLMDGDHLGKLLREVGETKVSNALGKFTEEVDGIIRKNCGKTIYAGGDDVMALLPLDGALEAASELRRHYLEAFEQEKDATTSGAIVFAHYNLSLRAVLGEAHHQLDYIAKERNGRDSLAVSVFTRSGRTVEWVSTWEDAHGNQLTNSPYADRLSSPTSVRCKHPAILTAVVADATSVFITRSRP